MRILNKIKSFARITWRESLQFVCFFLSSLSFSRWTYLTHENILAEQINFKFLMKRFSGQINFRIPLNCDFFVCCSSTSKYNFYNIFTVASENPIQLYAFYGKIFFNAKLFFHFAGYCLHMWVYRDHIDGVGFGLHRLADGSRFSRRTLSTLHRRWCHSTASIQFGRTARLLRQQRCRFVQSLFDLTLFTKLRGREAKNIALQKLSYYWTSLYVVSWILIHQSI